MIVPGSLATFLHGSAAKATCCTVVVIPSGLMSELFATQHVLSIAIVPDGSTIIRGAELRPLARDIGWLAIP